MSDLKELFGLLDDETDAGEEEPGIATEVKIPPDMVNSKGYPTLGVIVVDVNKFIVKINSVDATTDLQFDLAQMFFAGRPDCSQVEGLTELNSLNSFSKNRLVIASLHLDNVDGDDDEEMKYCRGVIVSSTPDLLWEVFLFDLGIIRIFNPFELAPVSDGDKLFLSAPPSYVVLTIPGIVPRKRMDNIPGLAKMNIQDTQWNDGARKDVEMWLTKYTFRLIYKIKEEAFSLWYGDLYGANSQESESDVVRNDSLSRYLITQKNVFMNLKALNLV